MPDYNRMHVQRAASYVDLPNADVLVVGCHTGKDCRTFIELGARSADGVDVMDDIGADFVHERCRYHKISAEDLRASIPDGRYDLVYSFATMEHVPDIAAAFREMLRVTRPGGWIYSFAAPLWNAPDGHHKSDLFGALPWFHLRFGRDDILRLCADRGIVPPDGTPIEGHIDYVFDRDNFNRQDAANYVEACARLVNADIIRNDLDRYSRKILPGTVWQALRAKGYSKKELLAGSHIFIARKRATPSALARFFWSIRRKTLSLLRALWRPLAPVLRKTGLLK